MADLKEQFLETISRSLIKDFKNKEVKKIIATITIALDKYNMTESCTDLVEVGLSDDMLLRNYAGTLLTEGKSKRTVEEYVRLLKKFRERVNKCYTDIDVFDIRLYLAYRQQEVSMGRCETERSYLSAFYHWLSIEEIIDKDPMVKIKPIKAPHTVKEAFSDIEIDALRSACETLRQRAILETLLSTGARVSELCAMNIADIDFNSKEVIIREGKGGKQRKTYLNDVCAVHLLNYLNSRTDAEESLIISRLEKRQSKIAIERELHRLGVRAGVTNVHPHRCRRTFATNLARRGMNVQTIQRLMGHSNINTTMRYIAISDEQFKIEYMKFA